MASDEMPTSLAAVHAAGASCLELPLSATASGQEAEERQTGCLTPHSMPVLKAPPSPASSATYSMPLYSPSQGSPMGSPFAARSMHAYSPGYPSVASSPMVTRASPVRVLPTSPQAAKASQPFVTRLGSQGFQSALSPTSMAQLSPGGAIRHNAAVLGIPLDLRGSTVVTGPHDYTVPIPVRTASGYVVAPSPVAARSGATLTSGLQPQQLNFSMPPPLPQGSAAMGQQTPAVIRAIVTPLRTGVRGGA
mmetsp:Transcript_22426/g.40456  ORF Transcript_22426/g.40456 Transcript_22426/m.40456 type:complete len:249 (-) Transcript_22426:143-889(-)|eukprot:CAMPEP_0197635050 /NCGR_PEP_ID=MMETSP1338-20131121/10976_1 /TAXON_ID=43686 ORGANISM="Pelagodinium beii, Strain RCC1491" /NCGR_SAMPLE_ID=MMETSP1338 /ASSEMBLY_ACC=CAM_ASM_000754 /LENGTH=248 /DNA_ID=CAMNT_0043207029 /DNA_START=45 /DNA_END=791 /DNA_ORIENTATION=+